MDDRRYNWTFQCIGSVTQIALINFWGVVLTVESQWSPNEEQKLYVLKPLLNLHSNIFYTNVLTSLLLKYLIKLNWPIRMSTQRKFVDKTETEKLQRRYTKATHKLYNDILGQSLSLNKSSVHTAWVYGCFALIDFTCIHVGLHHHFIYDQVRMKTASGIVDEFKWIVNAWQVQVNKHCSVVVNNVCSVHCVAFSLVNSEYCKDVFIPTPSLQKLSSMNSKRARSVQSYL